MKNKLIFTGLMLSILWNTPLMAHHDDEVLEESVRVVNVEVPVRVYYRGKPVDNLTRKDFRLTVGGKKRTIHGFYMKRKKINIQKLELDARRVSEQKSRFFVLVFRFTHYTPDVQSGKLVDVNDLYTSIKDTRLLSSSLSDNQ